MHLFGIAGPFRRDNTGRPDLWMYLYTAVLIYQRVILVSMSPVVVELRKHQWRSYMEKASGQQMNTAQQFCPGQHYLLFCHFFFFLLINLFILKLMPTNMMRGIALRWLRRWKAPVVRWRP